MYVEQKALALTLYRLSRRFRRLDACGQQFIILANLGTTTYRLSELQVPGWVVRLITSSSHVPATQFLRFTTAGEVQVPPAQFGSAAGMADTSPRSRPPAARDEKRMIQVAYVLRITKESSSVQRMVDRTEERE
jgi:hypothetical protein